MKSLLIDNYDSFTFNLYHLLAEVNGEEPLVARNDACDWVEVAQLPIDNIVISPGPGTPLNVEDFGMCDTILRETRKPVLGVCLGHQGLGSAYGATIAPAPVVMHGRLSLVYHDSSALFADLPQGFQAVRYHSLVVVPPLPACLETIAWTADGTIMGLRHRERPLWGVQFHPESVLTESGRQLITNFRDITRLFTAGGARISSAGRIPQARANEANRVLDKAHTMLPKGSLPRRPPLNVMYRRLETFYDPERTFVHLLAREPYAFWLDSSRVADGLSRFSFMGAVAELSGLIVRYDAVSRRLRLLHGGVTTYRSESIFDYLERELFARTCESPDLPFDFVGGFVGYFGYELKGECGATSASRARTPDATFLFADRFLAFDHSEGVTYLMCLTRQDEQAAADAWFNAIEERLRALPQIPATPLPVRSQRPVIFHLSRPYEEYLDNIRSCLRHLAKGDTYEVCLTNQLTTAAQMEPLATYRNLRRVNPAPYSAFLRLGALAVLSSSPERFLRIVQSRVEAKPIKGTAARGLSPEEDDTLREALHASEKDRAENLMIVDLLRNDLGRVCQIGSVHVPKLMEVESYQAVHHLVSTIRGQLRPDRGVIDCVRAAFPGGSMTGAPKLRTMQILDGLEAEPRGIYSGALGYLGINGTADLSIVIRTIVMEVGAAASIGVGGAIVAQSDPEREFDEILLKGRAPMEAIALTVTGSREEGAWQISNGRIPAR